MARLRRDIRPDGLRQRMIDKYVAKFHPESAGRDEWDDGFWWNGYVGRIVDQLRSGAPVEFYAWQIPMDARAPFSINDRVRLVGDEIQLIERL